MKRRNAECGKLRRPLKRSKITESIYGSTLLYVKFLVLWALVLLADFILEFRFEYLWPFWLLLRSVYDSFKYQGLAFSVFFVCIALTSDMICLLFIPVHWLFFAASTYVWVQYVWHTERGVCFPTVFLWLLFIYIEASVRLRDLKHLPFHLDLCRPFAAHCIGYPVVTLGFGFKSYIGYRMRQKKQKDVAKENEFYMQLLQQAMPPEEQLFTPSPEKSITQKGEEGISNGVLPSSSPLSQCSASKNNQKKSPDKGDRDKLGETEGKSSEKSSKYHNTNGTINGELEFMEKRGSINDFDENEADKDKSYKGSVAPAKTVPTSRWSNNHVRENATNAQKEKRNKSNKDTTNNISPPKDEYCLRLESDIKKLKADLQASRQIDQDLRSQIHSLSSGERSVKNELTQLQQDNDTLQTKLHGLVTARQMDKQTINTLEKKLQEERKCRAVFEAQLAAERKLKKAEEAAAARAVAMASANKSDCTESCKAHRRDLENEVKQLHRELKIIDDRCLTAEREAQTLRQYKDNHNETEILMSALSAMQDKNAHLENSLSAETRLKLDLFSALGEAKRQLEIRENLLITKDKEIEELKSKIAEVLAVMPPNSFTPTSLELTPSSSGLIYSSKLLLQESDTPKSSNLDPTAAAYTPKGTIATSAEA